MGRSNTQRLFYDLVQQAGLIQKWEDVHGQQHEVSRDTLQTVLHAQDLLSGSESQIKESLQSLEEDRLCTDSSLVIAEQGKEIVFSFRGRLNYQLELEGASQTIEGVAKQLGADRVQLPAQSHLGYHTLEIDGARFTLAVAPARCPSVPENASPSARAWGVAAQLYSLRRQDVTTPERSEQNGVPIPKPGAIRDQVGDYAALAQLMKRSALNGASAVAISPVHAMFSADPDRYSPYSPSSRLFYNALYVDPGCLGEEVLRQALDAVDKQGIRPVQTTSDLIDWPQVSRFRLALLRAVYEQFERHASEGERRSFADFRQRGGRGLQCHCIYEALHAHFASLVGPSAGWQAWPAKYHDSSGAATSEFAREHESEVAFHAFLQWQAAEGLRQAQGSAREAGMSIGLITDLAIGTDGGGSHVWSRPKDILPGLSVGAPPDLFQPNGQDWGLTAFSPRALRRRGFAPFLETLRSALAHAGGVRIDHILGLGRMWLVPHGEAASQGVYLTYPLHEMLSLIALEAHRHHAIVVGENLGTVPAEFNREIYQRGVLGTSVLWFERDSRDANQFKQPGDWSSQEMATTTTHDLPTIRGWWQGVDLTWRTALQNLDKDQEKKQEQERTQEKTALWDALKRSTATNKQAGGDSSAKKAELPKQPPRRAIFEFVAATPSPLAMFPLEDLLDLPEQPNLPGPPPLEGPRHPNWQRRLPLTVDALFESPPVREALDVISRARSRS